MVMTPPPDSSTPSRTTVAKPGSVKADLVGAGWQIGMRYCPVSSVTPVRTLVMSAGLDASIVHTREHGTRCVAHGSGEALCSRQAGSRAEDSHHYEQSDHYAIHEREPPQPPPGYETNSLSRLRDCADYAPSNREWSRMETQLLPPSAVRFLNRQIRMNLSSATRGLPPAL
jgi:hypothetical protein